MSTILVVDDIAVFREPIAASLAHFGYETVCAADGREALDKLATSRPDLILLDIAMPRMDGIEFLRALRSDPTFSNLPVILLTAVTDREYIVQAGQLGVRDCVLKSRFSLSDLVVRVAQYLHPGKAPSKPCTAAAGAPPAAAPATAPGNAPARAVKVEERPADAPAAGAALNPIAVDPNATALEALKSIKPIVTRSQINEHIESFDELKAMSPTVGQLLKLTQSANCSIDRVARTIKQDQAIALKVLKLANSVVYGRGEPVESVKKAVMRIGLSQIRQAVMNIAVIDQFTHDTSAAHINCQLFWEHSIATGMIAAQLTTLLNGSETEVESAFTMGLLHDVGRMVLAEHLKELYAQVLETADLLQLPLEQVESRMILVNHADLMDKLLHQWKFSKNLINPIAFHHLSIGNARKIAPRSITECATLGIANRLAHAMLLGSSGNEAIYPIEDFVHALKLKGSDIDRIVSEIPEQTSDVKFAMLAHASSGPWPDLLKQTRDRLGIALRPVFASSKDEIDAYGIFANRLADPNAEPGPPNIAVVHIPNVTERVKVTTRLRTVEQNAQVQDLPTLIISPKANILLEDSAMTKRPHELLPAPFSISRFIRAVRKLMHITPVARANAA